VYLLACTHSFCFQCITMHINSLLRFHMCILLHIILEDRTRSDDLTVAFSLHGANTRCQFVLQTSTFIAARCNHRTTRHYNSSGTSSAMKHVAWRLASATAVMHTANVGLLTSSRTITRTSFYWLMVIVVSVSLLVCLVEEVPDVLYCKTAFLAVLCRRLGAVRVARTEQSNYTRFIIQYLHSHSTISTDATAHRSNTADRRSLTFLNRIYIIPCPPNHQLPAAPCGFRVCQ